MLEAWDIGIRDSLGVVKGAVTVEKPKNAAPRIAKSDGAVLEFLRQKGGTASGTIKILSNELGIPQSTLSSSLKRLSDRGFVKRGSRSVTLISQRGLIDHRTAAMSSSTTASSSVLAEAPCKRIARRFMYWLCSTTSGATVGS